MAVGILRVIATAAAAALVLGGCGGAADDPARTPASPATELAPSPPGTTAGPTTGAASASSGAPTDAAPPSAQDVELELLASPSGVVCDLDVMDEYDAPGYDGARLAKCWVPDPQYSAWVFDEEEGSVELACEEDLVMVWPYNSEMWMECEPHQARDVPVLAEGSTSRSSGFECAIGADIIECLTDDGSGFGFRIGNALFEGLGQ